MGATTDRDDCGCRGSTWLEEWLAARYRSCWHGRDQVRIMPSWPGRRDWRRIQFRRSSHTELGSVLGRKAARRWRRGARGSAWNSGRRRRTLVQGSRHLSAEHRRPMAIFMMILRIGGRDGAARGPSRFCPACAVTHGLDVGANIDGANGRTAIEFAIMARLSTGRWASAAKPDPRLAAQCRLGGDQESHEEGGGGPTGSCAIHIGF